MEFIIELENLTVGYNNIPVVEKINFSVVKGEFAVILGKSGCGKTTILKTIIGFITPISGVVCAYGHPVDYNSEKSMQRLYHQVGVLFQNSALMNSLNLYENVSLPLKMNFYGLPKEIENEMVFARLTQVGLENSWDKFPHELSGGMRKRAALARALIMDPDIIFCDEPSAGLDPITAVELDDLLLSLRDLFGITFMVVTHELRSIERIADKVMVLKENEVYFAGSFDGLFKRNDPFINSFFLKDSKNG